MSEWYKLTTNSRAIPWQCKLQRPIHPPTRIQRVQFGPDALIRERARGASPRVF